MLFFRPCFFFFLPPCLAFGILVPWPESEPRPSAVKVWSPNHLTARQFLGACFFIYSRSVVWVTYCRSYLETSQLCDVYNQRILIHSLISFIFILIFTECPYGAGTAWGTEMSRRDMVMGSGSGGGTWQQVNKKLINKIANKPQRGPLAQHCSSQ